MAATGIPVTATPAQAQYMMGEQSTTTTSAPASAPPPQAQHVQQYVQPQPQQYVQQPPLLNVEQQRPHYMEQQHRGQQPLLQQEHGSAQHGQGAKLACAGISCFTRTLFDAGVCVLLIAILFMMITLIVLLMRAESMTVGKLQQAAAGSTLGSVYNALAYCTDDHYDNNNFCVNQVMSALASGSVIPFGDWLNGDVLRLNWGSYANKVNNMLPFYKAATLNVLQAIRQDPTDFAPGPNGTDLPTSQDVTDTFNEASKWLTAVGQFQQVTDSGSAPVHGSYPSVLGSTLDSLLDTALEPSQYQHLGQTCSLFIGNMISWYNSQYSSLPTKEEDLPVPSQFTSSLTRLRPLCQAVANASPSSLKAALALPSQQHQAAHTALAKQLDDTNSPSLKDALAPRSQQPAPTSFRKQPQEGAEGSLRKASPWRKLYRWLGFASTNAHKGYGNRGRVSSVVTPPGSSATKDDQEI